ncbi:MAG: homoserine dehydrogenase [Lachnospiraceae bacterium]|nr:homoserine dehydrogenase [Lachnospiraceae bacterium]
MISIAILGYGTVGSGVFEVFRTNSKSIAKKVGEEVKVKYVLDIKEFPADDPVNEVLTRDFDVILNDPEVSIVVEVLGGVEPSNTWATKCLEKGKSVCTSNKELVAKHGAKLIALAKEKNVNFFFEASVGGGIPIIRPLNHSVTADEILEISGILNGTTNYMLTKMTDEGVDYDTILKDAQAKGYAELHPEADVEGHDACRKIAILTSLAYGKQVDFEDIYTEGITNISDDDIKYAKAMNKKIKLLGTSCEVDGKVYAMVAPFMIGDYHPLYNVNDVFNAVFVKGNMVDDLMFYGKGAGKLPTAAAVSADVVEAARNLGRNIPIIWEQEKLELAPAGDFEHNFFVRVEEVEEYQINMIEDLFGGVLPIELEEDEMEGEYAFMTPIMKEADFQDKIKELDHVVSVIRVK